MKALLISSLVLYSVSFLLMLLKRSKQAGCLFCIGSLMTAIHVAIDWVSSGQPPMGSMHHIMIVLSACMLPAYLVIVLGRGMRWLAGFFPLAGALPVVAALAFKSDSTWHLAPALQSPWFVPHVIAYMLSYALCLIAFIVFVVSLKRTSERNRLADGSYELISFAFPLMTFGMLSGALWANSIWGRYWSWDAKETWSLITWILYLVYFHCRKDGRLKKYEGLSHFLAFTALLTTFLLVNLLPKLASKLHSYV